MTIADLVTMLWNGMKRHEIEEKPLLLRKPNGDKVAAVASFDADGTLVVREEKAND